MRRRCKRRRTCRRGRINENRRGHGNAFPWHGRLARDPTVLIARRRMIRGNTNSVSGGIYLQAKGKCLHGKTWFFHASPASGFHVARHGRGARATEGATAERVKITAHPPSSTSTPRGL